MRVLRDLERDTLERLFVLHHLERDGESPEVLHERAKMPPAADRRAEALDVRRGECHAVVFGKGEDGFQTQRAVQMDVEIRLG